MQTKRNDKDEFGQVVEIEKVISSNKMHVLDG